MQIQIDDKSFLSIYYPIIIIINNIPFNSVFHYVEAMKRTCYEEYLQISSMTNVDQVFEYTKDLDIRQDWEDIKYSILEYSLFQKYKGPPLLQKLLETGLYDIIDPTDNQNVLGELTMKVRRYYISLQNSEGQICQSTNNFT